MSRLTVGMQAPDFVLPGTGDRKYRLSDLVGQPVVLVFYPGDDTTVCTAQLGEYSQDIERFSELGAAVWGISPQNVCSHERFKEKRDLQMELLSDSDKAVGVTYGILGPLGFYRRSVFVVDGTGHISYIHRAMTGARYRTSDQLLDAVRISLNVANA